MLPLTTASYEKARKSLHNLISSPPALTIPARVLTLLNQRQNEFTIFGLKLRMKTTSLDKTLVDQILSPSEQKRVSEIKQIWRINQFIVGRFLAKQCIIHLIKNEVPDSLTQISVLGENFGIPVARYDLTNKRTPISLSITHKEDIVLAAGMTSSRIGIDLESFSKNHPGLHRKVITESEEETMDELEQILLKLGIEDINRILTSLWCAKEAAFKALNDGSIKSPLVVSLHPNGDVLKAIIQPSTVSSYVQIQLIPIDSYVLALAF